MSNTISYVTKSTFTALLNQEKVNVNYQAFLVNANSFGTASSDENVRRKSEKRIESRKEAVSPYIRDVRFILGTWDKNNKNGASIFKASEKLIDELEGVFDEYAEDEFERVGTLVEIKGKWIIETDLEVVEQIRRSIECEKIDAKTLRIGEMTSSKEYLAYLAEKDAEKGTLVTRGHGFY